MVLAFDLKAGYIRKCVTSWTNVQLLSIQQRSLCRANMTDSETCDIDLPPAETAGRLPHGHGQNNDSQFAVLCTCGSVSPARLTDCPDEGSHISV